MPISLSYTEDCPTFTLTNTSSGLPGSYIMPSINILLPNGEWANIGNVSLVRKYTFSGSLPIGENGISVLFDCGSVGFSSTEDDLGCYLREFVNYFNAATEVEYGNDYYMKQFITLSYENVNGEHTVYATSSHPGVYFNILDIQLTGITIIASTETSLVQAAMPLEYAPNEDGGLYNAYIYYYNESTCAIEYEILPFYNFCYDYSILNCCLVKLAGKTLSCRCDKYIPIASQVREKIEAAKLYSAQGLNQGAIALDIITSARFLCNDCGCGRRCR